jgi:hypothetical protein
MYVYIYVYIYRFQEKVIGRMELVVEVDEDAGMYK